MLSARVTPRNMEVVKRKLDEDEIKYDDYVSKAAKNAEEVQQLVEAGFERARWFVGAISVFAMHALGTITAASGIALKFK